MHKTIKELYKDNSLAMKLVATIFGITFIHHLWGEVIFGGGTRLAIAIVFAIVFALSVGLYKLQKTHRWALYLFWFLTIAFWVVLVGLVEGGYNHVLKVGAWLAGASPETIASFYDPKDYEPVSDFFFELTGVLTAIPAMALVINLFTKRKKSN